MDTHVFEEEIALLPDEPDLCWSPEGAAWVKGLRDLPLRDVLAAERAARQAAGQKPLAAEVPLSPALATIGE